MSVTAISIAGWPPKVTLRAETSAHIVLPSVRRSSTSKLSTRPSRDQALDQRRALVGRT